MKNRNCLTQYTQAGPTLGLRGVLSTFILLLAFASLVMAESEDSKVRASLRLDSLESPTQIRPLLIPMCMDSNLLSDELKYSPLAQGPILNLDRPTTKTEQEQQLAQEALVTDSYTPPEFVRISTPVYQPALSPSSFPEGTYNYVVSWQGIPAASLAFKFTNEGLYYRMSADAKTYSAIDIFYKLRYHSSGLVSALDLMPYRSIAEHRENSRLKFTELEFLDNNSVRAFKKTKGSDPQVVEFDPHNFMLDPFSAALLARTLDWNVGDVKEFDTFNGRTRYLIELTALRQMTLRVNDEPRKVWVISPKVFNLTNPKANKKLREAEIFVTADDKREILKIRSSVFIGSVTTTLESFQAPETSRVRTQLAKQAQRIFIE